MICMSEELFSALYEFHDTYWNEVGFTNDGDDSFCLDSADMMLLDEASDLGNKLERELEKIHANLKLPE